MIQIRQNVFETNSSSTHSLVMAVASEFDRWVNGEIYYCNSAWTAETEAGFEEGKFYSKETVEAYYNKKDKERDAYNFCTYDEFIESDTLEIESYSYTTPNGEVIKACAKFGYDG